MLRKRLKLWEQFNPQKEDFFSKFEIFDYDNYLYLLYGMCYQTKLAPLSSRYHEKAKAKADSIQAIAAQLSLRLPNHRELINKIKLYGLQNI